MLTIFSKGIPGVRIVATIFLLTPAVCSFHCDSWHRNQPSESEIMSITETASRRSPCQPSVPVTFPALLPNFEADKSCNPNNPRLCNFFHPGASSCYRSTNNFGSEVVQCCYDRNGGLLLGPPGGGTLDFADSKVSVQDHFWKDVLPYITCCKCSDKCSKYYEKRPSVNSRWFGVPRPGGGGGDPHFLTLDGTEYTFNPVGEFVHLATDLDVIQVRMSQFIDAQGVPKQGSYFSAFIFRYDNMDTVQIELNNLKMFNIFVNGESLSLGYGVWRFRGVSLNYINRTAVEVYMASGLTAEIHIQGRVLNIVILFPLSAKGKVKGLAGNWDDNQDNDLQTSSGTWIPSNSTSLEIHNIFGMSWSTTNSTSLFTYPTGLSWQDFQLPGFIPDHSQPPENPRCNGNAQCNYDAYVTGDIEVGLANIDRQRRLADLESSYSELSTRCPQNVSVNNGKVSSTKYNDTYITFTVTCNDDYKLSGKAEIICREGRYDPIPVCNAKVPTTSSAPNGLSASLFGLAAILALHGLLIELADD